MRAPLRPAVSIASRVAGGHAGTAHQHHLLRIAVADHALQFGAQLLCVAQAAVERSMRTGG